MVNCLQFNPDEGSKINIYDVQDKSRINILRPEGRVSRMKFSPDGKKFTYGLHGGEVEILDTNDWFMLYSFDQDETVEGLDFSRDSRKMVVGSGGTLYVYGY